MIYTVLAQCPSHPFALISICQPFYLSPSRSLSLLLALLSVLSQRQSMEISVFGAKGDIETALQT